MNEPLCLCVGVDWGTQEHAACAVTPEGSVVGERCFKHSGDGLAELVAWIERISNGHIDGVAVGIEVPHGAVVETLLERGCQVFAINPKQVDRFRDRFSLAGAKDDRRDAYVLADSLRNDRHCFRRLEVGEPLVLELREWSRIHDELGEEKVRLANRMRDQLRRYFPQYLELAGDGVVGDSWFLALWNRVPTPSVARRVRSTTVAAILSEHRVRRVSGEEALKILRQRPLTVAPGAEKAAVAHIRLVAERLEMVNRQICECDRSLDTLIEKIGEVSDGKASKEGEQRSDSMILLSMPGIGRIVLATLLAEAAEPLRRRDYRVLRALSGVAPVTSQSGKQRSGTKRRPRVSMRRACHRGLRTACYHWARVASQHDSVSRTLYKDCRSRGHTHGRALRGVADRLLALACSMLRHSTLYDPARRTAAVG